MRQNNSIWQPGMKRTQCKVNESDMCEDSARRCKGCVQRLWRLEKLQCRCRQPRQRWCRIRWLLRAPCSAALRTSQVRSAHSINSFFHCLPDIVTSLQHLHLQILTSGLRVPFTAQSGSWTEGAAWCCTVKAHLSSSRLNESMLIDQLKGADGCKMMIVVRRAQSGC